MKVCARVTPAGINAKKASPMAKMMENRDFICVSLKEGKIYYKNSLERAKLQLGTIFIAGILLQFANFENFRPAFAMWIKIFADSELQTPILKLTLIGTLQNTKKFRIFV
jgi:hypothetical protein